MVDRHSLKPVLLDFGLTKEVTPQIRYYFAKLLVAAAEQDIYGLMDALNGVGLRLRTDVPFDIALLAKYFFRDANRQDVARAESQQRREEYKSKAEERQKTLYIGDKVDVFGRGWVPYMKTSRKGEVVDVSEGNCPAAMVKVKLSNGHIINVRRDHVSLQKSRSPIDAWPDSFIFFDRVLGLLRGLTASLDVSTSYLKIMTPYARKTLKDYESSKRIPRPGPILSKDVAGVDLLDGKIASLLQKLIDSGDILGTQVSVISNGRAIVDLAAGNLIKKHTHLLLFSSRLPITL